MIKYNKVLLKQFKGEKYMENELKLFKEIKLEQYGIMKKKSGIFR